METPETVTSEFKPDLVREILIHLESRPPSNIVRSVTIENFDPEQVSYHVKLLFQAGFIEARDVSTIGRPGKLIWLAGPMTYEGQQFLTQIKDVGTWTRIKTALISKGIPMTIAAIQAVATDFGKQLLKDSLGI